MKTASLDEDLTRCRRALARSRRATKLSRDELRQITALAEYFNILKTKPTPTDPWDIIAKMYD
jgi:hypothetical protein